MDGYSRCSVLIQRMITVGYCIVGVLLSRSGCDYNESGMSPPPSDTVFFLLLGFSTRNICMFRKRFTLIITDPVLKMRSATSAITRQRCDVILQMQLNTRHYSVPCIPNRYLLNSPSVVLYSRHVTMVVTLSCNDKCARKRPECSVTTDA